MNAASNIFTDLASAFAGAFPSVNMGHMVVLAGVLFLLVIVFLCATIAKNHAYGEVYEEYGRVMSELKERDEEVKRIEGDAVRAKAKMEDELSAAKAEKDDAIADLTAQLDVLKQFYEKYQSIPEAEKEAARIMSEAKDKAFIVANRTEKEYIELIEQANKEAESIRQLAHERLTRSHETLKSAIARANEIVDEARSDSSRQGVTYVPQPARIQAPVEEPMDETENEDD